MTKSNGEWQTLTIGDLGKVVTGKTPTSARPELFGDDYPFVTPTDMDFDTVRITTARYLSREGRETQRNLLLPKDSVCFCCIGATIGKICMTARESFTNQQINSVIVNADRHDPYFVYSLLRTLRHDIVGIASGAATPIVNKATFTGFRVVVPVLPIQRKISGILSAYDDLIENNTRRIAILEEMAQTIYRQWFVHFRFPGHEKTKLVNSPMGNIPEGWTVGRLDDVLVLQRGFDLPVGQRLEGNVPVYAATGIVGTHNETKVKGPGVLTGRSGSLGTVTYVHEDHWPLNTALWVKEFKKPSPLFAYYTLRSVDFSSFNSGAAVPTLNRNDIHGLPTLLPSDEIIVAFHEIERPLFDFARVLRKKNEKLRTTRDLLLPKLISGQPDVEELDIETGEPLVEAVA